MEERHRGEHTIAGSFYPAWPLPFLRLLFLTDDGRTDGHVVRSVRAKGHSNTYAQKPAVPIRATAFVWHDRWNEKKLRCRPLRPACLNMRRRKVHVYSSASALATCTAVVGLAAAAAVFGGGAANNIPSVVDAVPIDELHDKSQTQYNAKNRMRRRQDGSNGRKSDQERNLGLLSDLQNHAGTVPDESGGHLVAGRSQSRHRIRRHNPDGLLTKLLEAEPVNTVTQTDVSQVSQGRTSASNVIYSSELFPRDGHQQLILVGDVITVQTTQADIPTDFIVGANNQVFDTTSGQPVAVQPVVFWNQSKRGFENSSGIDVPVDISVVYVSDSSSYFSGDSTQGRYEIRNGKLYYIRADGTAINTGFTVENGTNELIFIKSDGAIDRTGVAYRAGDQQFILISSGEIVQFEITTETITVVEEKVTEDQVVVETDAGIVIIEENSDAQGGVVGGDGNDDSSDEDCKSTVKSYRGKGRGGGGRGKGKGRYRRHRSRGKGRSYSKSKKKKSKSRSKSSSSKSKKKKSKSKSKSSKGSRRLVEMELLDDETDEIGRQLKSSKRSSHSKSKRSSHSKSSKSSYSGTGKGRYYSGKGRGKGYSPSRSKKKNKKKASTKKKNNRCD